MQHGSPPLALLTKADRGAGSGVGPADRPASLEILGAIPVAPLRARAWVERPGTRIS